MHTEINETAYYLTLLFEKTSEVLSESLQNINIQFLDLIFLKEILEDKEIIYKDIIAQDKIMNIYDFRLALTDLIFTCSKCLRFSLDNEDPNNGIENKKYLSMLCAEIESFFNSKTYRLHTYNLSKEETELRKKEKKEKIDKHMKISIKNGSLVMDNF